jgi:hypothetical protein
VDRKEEIALANVAFAFECTLACDDVDFAQLGEREAVGVLDGQLQVVRWKLGVEVLEVLLSKFSAGVSEVDDAVKASWSAQDRRVEDRGFVGGCHDNDPLASANTVKVVEELLKTDAALRLTGSWKCSIEIFEQDHRWSIFHSEHEQVVEIAVVDLGIKKSHGVGSQAPARHHRADGGRLAVARRAMQKIATSKREFVFAEPSLTLKERLKVVFKKGSDFVIENEIIPLAADDGVVGTADDMKAWLVIAAIELFKQPHHLGGVLAAGDDEPRCTLKVATRTGVVRDVDGNNGEL